MLRRSVQVFNRLAVRRSAGVGSDARALHRAAPGVELRGKRLSLRARLLAGLSLAAVLLAAVAGLQAPPLGAQTTTDVILARVLLGSTFGNTTSSRISAQKFTTGSNPLGYSISQIRIRMGNAANHVVGKDIIVRIKADGVNNRPGDVVATLTNPASLSANSLNSFTAPPGTILDPDTPYWLTVNEGLPTNSDMAAIRISLNQSDDSNYGWDIANGRLYKSPTTNWAAFNNSMIFQVRGTVRVVSTDATLSDLRVTHGGGSPVALSPGFSSDEFEYNASVEFPVSQVTVAPTKNHPLASVTFRDVRDGSNNQLSDADTSRSGFQANLVAGAENVIKVEVTAEDGTTQPYTVIVTRAGEPGQVLLSSKILSFTEGNTASYTVALDRAPKANVTVTVGTPSGTAVTTNPNTLTFSTTNWRVAQSVNVSATADTNTTNESFPLTHTATSSDSLFDGITIPSVIVNVDDQDAPDHHIRTITVPYGLPLGETALPEEEFEVWIGPPFEETIEGVTQGHQWSPSGLWGDPDADIIWVVDPIHFGIHALKLSALKQGRVERHIAADTAEFDHRFNYRCHFSESRASGYGNPSLTVMWGSPTRVLIANESSGTLDAYDRDSSITNQCYTRNVTSWAADGQSYTTADENFKSPFGFVREFDLPLGQLTVWGIWANSTQVWLSGPTAGVYTIDLDTGQVAIAPGYEGHGTSYGLWSDGTTMWVAADSGWLRAYNLNSGSRRAEFDIRIQTYGMPPGDIWSDSETIWVTNRMGNIDAYRLPGTSGGSRTLKATEADPLTASFALAPEAHDGENGFKLRIAFSDDVEITPEDMRDHALLVSGGTVTDAARVKGRSDLWELTVEPTGPDPVSVLAPLGRACTDQGALCTADGRSLTAGPALVVPGPPAQQANSQATGAPSISGTAQVGETLTAGTSDIADDDGLTNVSYSYQWIRSDGSTDTSIQDATGSSYTLSEADEGQTVKVTVSFADDADNKETLTSTATAEVAAGAPTDPPGNPRNLTGAANSDGTVTLSWDAPNDDSVTGYQILRRRPGEGEKTLLVHVNDTGSTATEYTDSDVTLDVRHVYRVKAINAAGLSSWSNFVRVTPTQPAEPARNSPPTGMLTIGGTVQVGETLTADTSGIADDDGLTNVSYGYQWIVTDGGADIDITSATDSSYTLADADEGLAIKVNVSFTDDAGNEESLTSAATDDVASAGPKDPPLAPENLTAEEDAGGSVTLTWEAPDDDSVTGYRILRRNADAGENAMSV